MNVALFVAAALIAALPILVFVLIRESVKQKRQEIIRNLQKIFASQDSSQPDILPSLEFVKYKYFIKAPGAEGAAAPRDFQLLHWFLVRCR